MLQVALTCLAAACTFKAPNANKPLGCACDPRPNAHAYCKYDACDYAGCRSGFFDLDGEPSNGCEADRTALPGNLVVPLGMLSSTYWYSEFRSYSFQIEDGIATATVSDPTCRSSATHSCDIRLEAFQVTGSRNRSDDDRSDDKQPTEVVLGTTTPLTGIEYQKGATFVDASTFFASFDVNGSRAPLIDATGSLTVLSTPLTIDGTVRLNVRGNFEGYVADRKGRFTFNISGKTQQLFDASAPEVNPRDAQADGEAGDDLNTDAGAEDAATPDVEDDQ